MALSTPASLVDYTSDGSLPTFSVPFPYFENAHLRVSKIDLSSVETVLTEGADYTIGGSGKLLTGTVTLSVAVTSGWKVRIRRIVDLLQKTSFRSQGAFDPGTHEIALDKTMMAVQQLNDGVLIQQGLFNFGVATPETVAVTATGGTASRTLAARFAEVKHVKDFGAVGDGVADDTVAIQAALNGLQQYQALNFGRGTYKISNTISRTGLQDAVVYGQGARIIQTGANKKSLSLVTPNNVEIFGLQFVGKGTEHNGASTSYNGVAGVHFDAPTNVSVHDCVLKNHAGGAIRWITSANGLRIYDNFIAGIGAAGGIVANDNNGDFAIGSFSSTGGDNSILVARNDVSAHCFGIGLARGSGCVIADNVIHDIPGQHGMYLSQQSNLAVVGNVIQTVALEGMKDQLSGTGLTASDILVSGNKISDCGGSGINVGATSTSTSCFVDRVSIVGNHIYRPGTYGVTVGTGVRGAVIANNSIWSAGAYGIFADASNGVIRGNYVKNANWNGILAQLSDDTEIRDNIIEDAVLNVEAGGALTRYQYYVNVTRSTAAVVANPKLVLANNTFRATAAEPTQYIKCVRTGTAVDVYWSRNWNFTSKGWQFTGTGELKYIDIGLSKNVDYTASNELNPTTPIYGRGRRELYGTQSPSSAAMTDTFRAGDLCWNATPAAGGPSGWICTASGTPGTWKEFGFTLQLLKHLTGTATWDPASIADSAFTSTTVTVTGAVVGDTVNVGFSNAVPAGALLVGAVTAANTVTVTLFNKTGGAVDLASGTLRVDVWQH